MRLTLLFILPALFINPLWAEDSTTIPLGPSTDDITVVHGTFNRNFGRRFLPGMNHGMNTGVGVPYQLANDNEITPVEDCPPFSGPLTEISSFSRHIVGKCLSRQRRPAGARLSDITSRYLRDAGINQQTLWVDPKYNILPPDKEKCDCVLHDDSAIGRLYQNSAPNPFIGAINTNLGILENVLDSERNAMRFQASTLADNANDSTWSTATYSFNNAIIVDNLRGAVSKLKDSREKNGLTNEGIRDVALSSSPNDGALLNDAQRDPRNCIPMRAFLASKQIPQSNTFYQDLNEIQNFNESDWDYGTLYESFINKASKVNTLDEALRDPETKRLYERIKFLHHNPLFKNLFSSKEPGSKSKKEVLFGKIKEIFTPPTACWSDPGAVSGCIYAMSQKKVYGLLRDATKEIFSNEDVVRMTRKGAESNIARILKNAPIELQSLVTKSDAQLWGEAMMQSASFNSENYDASTDLQAHIQYCLHSRTNEYASQVRVSQELSRELGDSFSSDPAANSEYRRLNDRFCQTKLADVDGNKETYAEFRNARCPGMEMCAPERESEMLSIYMGSVSFDGTLSTAEQNTSLALQGALRVDLVNQNADDQKRTESLASNKNLFRTEGSRAAMSRIRSSSKPTSDNIAGASTVAASRSPASTSSSSLSSSSSSSSNSTPDLGGQQFVAGPMLPISSSPTEASRVSTTTEVARQELVRSETEIRSIQNDISSLSTNLQRELSKGPTDRDSDLVRDLNTRLDQMNARLDSALANNQRLQADLERAEAQNAARAASERTRSSGNDEESPRAASASQNQTGNPQAPLNNQQPQTVNTQAPALRSSDTARLAAPVNTRLASRGQATGGEILSSLAASGSSVSAAPSIVVSNSSQGEYMRLLAQTIGNEVTQVVPADVFNSIASSSPDPRVIQSTLGSSLPANGQVGRFQIKKEGTSDEVEMLISRTGEQYSITFGKRVGAEPEVNPQRAPASADGVRLIDLQQAVQRENE